MSFLYADTSALIRAYFVDEPDHEELRMLLREGTDSVVTSTLARVEFASAAASAARCGRISDPTIFQKRFDAEGEKGQLTLLDLDPQTVLPFAFRLVGEYRLRTLDAIHLAVALTEAKTVAAGAPIALVTRDKDQAEAAKALGMEVR